jgi:hypothetical protein
MTTTAQTIYGDETGFSGNNLLDEAQPYFVYCTVALSPEHSEELVSQAKRDFRLDNPELKGLKLLRHSRGRKAITWLAERCADRAKLSVYEKKYTLAGKFFEYIFEPVVASKSSFFYNVGFHRFIANLIYLEVFVKDPYAEKALANFQELMKKRDSAQLPEMSAGVGRDLNMSTSLSQILTFAAIHNDLIAEELHGLASSDGVGKGVLDVTTDALFNQLCEWGEEYDVLDVYYDPSKPVYAVKDILFDRMVGRTDRAYMGKRPLSFNLVKPIEPGESKLMHGIQIADVLSAATAFSLKQPRENVSHRWRELLFPSIGERLVLPFIQMIDFNNPQTYANAGILWLLVERSLKGENLLDDLPRFFELSLLQHKHDPSLKAFLTRETGR